MKTKQKRQKRAVTLVELIVVIALITIITAALAYNYRGSLNEGKVFKTKQNIERVKNILEIKIGEGKSAEEVVGDWRNIVKSSPLGGDKHIEDGFGKELQVTLDSNGAVQVTQAS